MTTTPRPNALAATGPLAIAAAPIAPAAALGHVVGLRPGPDIQPLPGVNHAPHTSLRPGYVYVEMVEEPAADIPLCGDETVIPGGGDCGPCRCVKPAGHVPPTSITEWDPDADHQCACGDRWDDPTEPNSAEPHGGW